MLKAILRLTLRSVSSVATNRFYCYSCYQGVNLTFFVFWTCELFLTQARLMTGRFSVLFKNPTRDGASCLFMGGFDSEQTLSFPPSLSCYLTLSFTTSLPCAFLCLSWRAAAGWGRTSTLRRRRGATAPRKRTTAPPPARST